MTAQTIRAAVAAGVLALGLAACSADDGAAMVACEGFVDQRVGAEVEHRSPMDGATVEGDGPYVVHSAFTEPATGRTTSYTCTVEQIDGGWRLVDLQTSR